MDRFSHITRLTSHMDAITKISRQMDAMQKAINPAASFMDKFSHSRLLDQQMAAIGKAIAPNMEFMDKIASMNKLNEQIAAFSRSIPDMSYAAAIPSYSFLDRQIDLLIKSATYFGKFSSASDLALKSMNSFVYPIEKLEAALNSYSTILDRVVPRNSFEDTFKEVLRRVQEADDSDTLGKVESVAEDFEAESQKAQISISSYRFFMDALAIISFILTVMSYMQFDKNPDEGKSDIFEELLQVEERLTNELKDHLVGQPNASYYVALRAVKVMTKPHSRKGSKTIAFLFQNNTVRLVERKGKWVRVEYYDYVTGVHENGWCLKKYLKLIGPIKIPQT